MTDEMEIQWKEVLASATALARGIAEHLENAGKFAVREQAFCREVRMARAMTQTLGDTLRALDEEEAR